ncbi:MAG TPA: S8 family serine peptidase [Gaiellaceae bacterium]
MSALRRVALLLVISLASLVLLTAAGASSRAATPSPGGLVEVVVTLPQPSLAEAITRDRALAGAATTRRRLNLRAPAAVRYTRTLAAAQRALAARIATRIPQARIRWRYDVTLNGMAVALPRTQLGTLSRLPGVTVWPSIRYHEQLDRTPQLIGAPQVWGAALATAGQGMKIGIIDDGIDQTHPFFNPAGFNYPPDFPKGDKAYTTPKVIVARAFAPARERFKYARTPFDPLNSDHATHVAGIAAGDHGTTATFNGAKSIVSGIAPDAYLGNYKVLTIPTAEFGLDGNSPEIAAGIEAAVKDGMDVINLSLGEPEIEPTRDIVVAAINAAADAGVVPVVAAGNGFGDSGRGGIGSPGTAAGAITVAASSEGGAGTPADMIASFSDSAPTPVSLQFKPDVTAPGQSILSSIPRGDWDRWDGTSMATPHVAGAAAVLKQRHPTWTVPQIKSALATTGVPVRAPGGAEVSALREGGGRIELPRADDPLVFVSPTNLSFGLVARGATVARTLTLTDAGGGPGPWNLAVAAQSPVKGATLTTTVPTAAAGASVGIMLTVSADAVEGDGVGFITLTRGADVRRVPYWFHVEIPRLGEEPHRTLVKPGVYGGNTAGKKSLVSSYRYPELGNGAPIDLTGPEQVFRFVLKTRAANFGVAILSRAKGVQVAPRVVQAGDENRLVGAPGLPVDINPYRDYGREVLSVGAILPKPGAYDIVFDTPSGGKPGQFTFRFWVGDTTPPRVRMLPPLARSIRLGVTDAGAGVDRGSIALKIDGVERKSFTLARNVLTARGVRPGWHKVSLVVSDFQEPKNMENVGPVLPNTRTFTARVHVH